MKEHDVVVTLVPIAVDEIVVPAGSECTIISVYDVGAYLLEYQTKRDDTYVFTVNDNQISHQADTYHNPTNEIIRGQGLFKEEWYSICSRSHPTENGHDKGCPMCRCGCWSNVYAQRFSSLIYKLFPTLWRKCANWPHGKSRKWLQVIYPNLK